jgi:hypothetical protein
MEKIRIKGTTYRTRNLPKHLKEKYVHEKKVDEKKEEPKKLKGDKESEVK